MTKARDLANLLSAGNVLADGVVSLSEIGGGSNNGVAYFNGSGVGTSGSALTFDGTNLGIGTSSPSEKLHVAGVGLFKSNTNDYVKVLSDSGALEICRNAGDAYIDFKNSDGEDYDCRIQSAGTGGTLTFSNAGGERMRLDSSGNVGIGTSSPGAKLDVAGFTRLGNYGGTFQGVTLQNNNNSASAETVSFIDAQNNLSIADSNIFFVHQTDGGSYIGLATTSPGSRSTDRRVERARIGPSGYFYTGPHYSYNINYTYEANLDVTNTTWTAANNAFIDMVNFSGMLILNDHTTGGVGVVLLGGGTVTTVGSTGAGHGLSVSYNSGINGYTIQNWTGTTRTWGIVKIRTRLGA